ncbi:hypothetical protein [Paraburkholderia sp. BL17N1]|nr:hypothetical protein [Paraburkholderia sp. BL17N1]
MNVLTMLVCVERVTAQAVPKAPKALLGAFAGLQKEMARGLCGPFAFQRL